MSEDYLAQQPTATWNHARGVWETTQVNLLCAHSEPYLETWPTSGMTRNGRAYELPTLEHRTIGLESSLSPIPEESMLRTPSAIEGQGGAISEDAARSRGRMLQVRDQMAQLAYENGLKVSESIEQQLFPTPTVSDQYTDSLGSTQQKDGSLHSVTLAQVFHREDLFPTPKALDGVKGNLKTSQQRREAGFYVDLPNVANDLAQESTEINWAKFEPAIRRWEKALNRPAPAPTIPDGKDGAHRLSSKLTEWMMGLPEGWITDCGLTRNEELKAAGNGVVPQQAYLALQILLGVKE